MTRALCCLRSWGAKWPRGRRFPLEPISVMDAIHLASAETLEVPLQLVTIMTRDARVRENARALGYTVE